MPLTGANRLSIHMENVMKKTDGVRRVSGGVRKLGVFTGHMLVATVMYLVVLLVSAATGLVVDWVATWCNDKFMLATMNLVGNALMLLDGVCLLWAAAWSTVNAFKDKG